MDRHHMTARLHLQPSSAAVVQPKYYGNRCFREANAAYHSWRLAAARPEYWRRWVTLGSDIVRRPTHESRSVATTESASAADSHRAETMNSVDYKPHDNHKFLTHSGKHHKDYHLNIHLHLGELGRRRCLHHAFSSHDTVRKLWYGFLFDFPSNCGSISYRFGDKARYWSKIPSGGFPSEYLPYRLVWKN